MQIARAIRSVDQKIPPPHTPNERSYRAAYFPCSSGCYENLRFVHTAFHHELDVVDHMRAWLQWSNLDTLVDCNYPKRSPTAIAAAAATIHDAAQLFALLHANLAEQMERKWVNLAENVCELPGQDAAGAVLLRNGMYAMPGSRVLMTPEQVKQLYTHTAIDTATGLESKQMGLE